MRAGTKEIVDDDPRAGFGLDDRSAMHDAEPLVPVMLRFEHIRFLRLRAVRRTICPICPEKAAQPSHLVEPIDCYRVMKARGSEGVMEWRLRVVTVSAGVGENVKTAPPKINVKLIDVRGAIVIASSADHRPTVVTGLSLAAHRIVTADGRFEVIGRSRGGHFRVQRL